MVQTIRIPSVDLEDKTQKHLTKWNNCTRCPLHKDRKRVVSFRGFLPAEICFIGEAPGECEDTLGFPFVGPSGDLLEQILEDVRLELPDLRWAIFNTVGCIPWNPERAHTGKATRAPTSSEIQSCSGRLKELLDLASPRTIFLLGQTAQQNLPEGIGAKIYQIAHPAFILRHKSKLDRYRMDLYTTITRATRKPVTKTVQGSVKSKGTASYSDPIHHTQKED